MTTNQQIAEELLRVISNSEHHNTAWALKETLEKLRELISGTNENEDELADIISDETGWCIKSLNYEVV